MLKKSSWCEASQMHNTYYIKLFSCDHVSFATEESFGSNLPLT